MDRLWLLTMAAIIIITAVFNCITTLILTTLYAVGRFHINLYSHSHLSVFFLLNHAVPIRPWCYAEIPFAHLRSHISATGRTFPTFLYKICLWALETVAVRAFPAPNFSPLFFFISLWISNIPPLISTRCHIANISATPQVFGNKSDGNPLLIEPHVWTVQIEPSVQEE